MPLRSGGAIENDRLKGKVYIGLTARSLSGTFTPAGLAPEKVAETDEGDPTRDTYQRKVFYDGSNFFVLYWMGAPTKETRYCASIDGKTWTSPTTLDDFTVGPYYGGNIDVQYPNRGALDVYNRPYDLTLFYMGSNGGATWEDFYNISDQTLQFRSGASCSMTTTQGGSVIASLKGDLDFWIVHRTDERGGVAVGWWTDVQCESTEVPYGGTTTGGAQILTYKTSSPFTMFALAKGGDNKLYYNLVDEEGFCINSFVCIATLGTGFSDFCACSEAQNKGDPERIHLAYIKSTGELCYNKFENDALGTEKVLVISGASYPVIAVGSGGKLYISYVKDGKIWVIHFNGIFWLVAVELFTDEHTYNNPTYLSSNQNVQNGKICLVWTEGTGSPYEVWFCYLED